MALLLRCTIGAAACGLLLWIYQQVGVYLAFVSKRRETGCFQARTYPHRDGIFGYDLYKQRKRALEEGNMQALYTREFDQLGKVFRENFLRQPVINNMDALNHQYIHALGWKDFGKPLIRAKANGPILGNGIFAAEGSEWKQSRDIIKPIFAKAEVGNMAMMAKHVDHFLDLLPRDSGTFDIQIMFKKLFLDLSTEFLFGESIDAQTPKGAPKADGFLKALDEALLGWNKRRQAGILMILHSFDRRWPRACQRLYNYFDKHVYRALETTSTVDLTREGGKEANEDEGKARVDPSRKYILLYEMAKQVRDPVQLRFELLNVFIPSHGTTAALLGNVFFLLARHTHHWTRLRKHALSLPFDPADPSALDFARLKSLLPFRYVIQETLRVLGPAGRVFRAARYNTTLPRGGGPDGLSPVFIPKGAVVMSSTYHIQHDRDIWGEDADEFRPERWEEPHNRGPWDFVPFLGGPRICPAQQQVLVQAIYLLLRMVREFESIENRDNMLEYVEQQRMAIESRRGVQIALRPG